MKTEIAFWDTSASLLLCVNQADSSRSRQIARKFRQRVIWEGSLVEAESAFCRLLTQNLIDQKGSLQARNVWQKFEKSAFIIQTDEKLIDTAKEIPEKYNLRTLDSLQLAAALHFCKEKPKNRNFICFDEKLSKAAQKVGFTVVP